MTSTAMGQFTVLHPQGSFDAQRGEQISRQIEHLSSQMSILCLDLAGVGFMDSAGLGKLVHGLKAARQQGCRLVLCNIPGQVKLILDIARLEGVFEIYPSYEKVLEVFQPDQLMALSAV
ncbi:STAS domain-containing protein [Roseofilum sp. Belize Diploria]|uniref:STAS domain-containing protein n=1 Tax=Roseofilum sp. Belize Diploria TaxID=2821501 RepID=UPI000E937193|nr:STAS domain-containing protein [Roseofilum sp. Belize Diploria]MBP0008228.1 STAS domain-containing protein [Roseofilum sp. Belize Diploria]HBQ97645.1 anti-anti-sigma factor [Cyanobacteria bacterium UBA11691]